MRQMRHAKSVSLSHLSHALLKSQLAARGSHREPARLSDGIALRTWVIQMAHTADFGKGRGEFVASGG